MTKIYEVRCSTNGLGLLEGEIMTSYKVEANNDYDAQLIAREKFKSKYPLTEKIDTYILSKKHKPND